jgi:hypothetical protein
MFCRLEGDKVPISLGSINCRALWMWQKLSQMMTCRSQNYVEMSQMAVLGG